MTVVPRSDARSRLGAVLSATLACVGALVLAAAAAAFRGSAGEGYDLAAYLDAARRVAGGASPYNPDVLAGPFRPGPFGLYLYPPPLAVAMLPLTVVPPGVAVSVWLALRIALLAAACAVLPVGRSIRAALFGVSCISLPVLLDINLGNVSVVVLALTAFAWRTFNAPASGVAVAVAALLRAPTALLALPWIVHRAWKPVLAVAAAGLVAIALTLPFVGIQGWLDYVTVVRNLGGYQGVPRNVDAGSAALALGLPDPIPAIAFLAFAAAAAASLVIALRRDAELAFVVAVSTSLLVAPLLWAHYLVLLVIPAAFLAQRGRPWAVALPLLGWLPEVALPLAALSGAVLPLLTIRRTEAPPGRARA
jgi:alpha-1,2-mannosyltransferase